jgi:hypothetical protein
MAGMPEFTVEYCDKCGEKMIDACPQCEKPIRGYYWGGGLSVRGYEPPAHCINCGTTFPWTERTIQAAIELAADEAHLNAQERDEFAASVGDLTRQTARTPLAISRFKRYAGRMTKEGAIMLRETLASIFAETVKRQIWP